MYGHATQKMWPCACMITSSLIYIITLHGNFISTLNIARRSFNTDLEEVKSCLSGPAGKDMKRQVRPNSVWIQKAASGVK